MGPDVFISYSSKEKKNAEQVKTVIETNGYSCWMAPESIPGGSSYAAEIESAIQNCKVMLVVLSKTAQESIWIPKEISSALGYKKIVVPFHIDESNLVNAFKFYLTDAQRIEAYQNLTSAYEQLISLLEKIIGSPVKKSESVGNSVSRNISQKAGYNACKIYISSDSGSICFASDIVKSYEEDYYLDFDGEIEKSFKSKLEKLLSNLYQIDTDMISVEFISSNNKTKLIPSSELNWNAWSVDDDYKIRFRIKRLEPEKELLYDSLSLEIGSDLDVSFYSKGNYINKPGNDIFIFSQLGISEEDTVRFANDLIKLCYPGKMIKTNSGFVPKFYNDGSGGYHLSFLVI